eukprot:gene7844-8693_t
MTKRLLPVYLLVIWLASTAVASPMIYAQKLSKVDGKMYCAESWGRPFDAVESPKHYTIILFVTLYAIPLFIMTFLYAAIGRKLWKRNIPGHRSFQSENIASKQKRKVIKMLVIIVLVFAICWFPIFLIQFLVFFDPYFVKCPQSLSQQLIFAAYFLQYASSAINPYIYFTQSQAFHSGIVHALHTTTLFARRIAVVAESAGMPMENRRAGTNNSLFTLDNKIRKTRISPSMRNTTQDLMKT